MVLATASLTLTFRYLRRHPRRWVRTRGQLWLFSATTGFVVAASLATSPLAVNALHYTTLRGNGTDSFNYLALAGYLDHEPLSWASSPLQVLIDPYVRARWLLSERRTTHMMVAYMSRLAGGTGGITGSGSLLRLLGATGTGHARRFAAGKRSHSPVAGRAGSLRGGYPPSAAGRPPRPSASLQSA